MIWAVALLALGCIILLIHLLQMRREIARLSSHIEEVKPNAQYGARLYLQGNDAAIEEIAAAINALIDDYEEKLRRTDAMEENVKLSISAISHDLRTPLTTIQGYLQHMEKTPHITIIQENVKTLLHLIENFYDLSRLEMGIEIFTCTPIDLLRVVNEKFLQFYQAFEEKNITVTLPDITEAMHVHADPHALDRILNNLIQNLLRYAKSEAQITITPMSDTIQLTLTNDSHTPLPPNPDALFERFYTTDPSRASKNAGLGLYIVRKLVQGLGGGVSAAVEDERFMLTLKFSRE
ncbi:MAG: HAMP domain-containing histidine kinase [Defluviitaleaceae bacterium]|nr:HAMP domain-containing histidine kinase [Defluviitaleaceae bacterium]MCL2275915.1 HAMP domain-containing histidine kinase [Defluviitaleaceae bacterium]